MIPASSLLPLAVLIGRIAFALIAVGTLQYLYRMWWRDNRRFDWHPDISIISTFTCAVATVFFAVLSLFIYPIVDWGR